MLPERFIGKDIPLEVHHLSLLLLTYLDAQGAKFFLIERYSRGPHKYDLITVEADEGRYKYFMQNHLQLDRMNVQLDDSPFAVVRKVARTHDPQTRELRYGDAMRVLFSGTIDQNPGYYAVPANEVGALRDEDFRRPFYGSLLKQYALEGPRREPHAHVWVDNIDDLRIREYLRRTPWHYQSD